MSYDKYSDLKGKHAMLSPSGFHWLNYDLDEDPYKLFDKLVSTYATEIGTHCHDFAQKRINHFKKINLHKNRIRRLMDRFVERVLPFFGIDICSTRLTKANASDLMCYLLDRRIPIEAIDLEYIYPTLMAYVNDCVHDDMETEIVVCYDPKICFGTADAIKFRNKHLKIYDLKTGKSPAHFEQLIIYAALFCLQERIDPMDISFELRLYQNSEVGTFEPTGEEIKAAMNQIMKATDLARKHIGLEEF